jgi:hypothetical protein
LGRQNFLQIVQQVLCHFLQAAVRHVQYRVCLHSSVGCPNHIFSARKYCWQKVLDIPDRQWLRYGSCDIPSHSCRTFTPLTIQKSVPGNSGPGIPYLAQTCQLFFSRQPPPHYSKEGLLYPSPSLLYSCNQEPSIQSAIQAGYKQILIPTGWYSCGCGSAGKRRGGFHQQEW